MPVLMLATTGVCQWRTSLTLPIREFRLKLDVPALARGGAGGAAAPAASGADDA